MRIDYAIVQERIKELHTKGLSKKDIKNSVMSFFSIGETSFHTAWNNTDFSAKAPVSNSSTEEKILQANRLLLEATKELNAKVESVEATVGSLTKEMTADSSALHGRVDELEKWRLEMDSFFRSDDLTVVPKKGKTYRLVQAHLVRNRALCLHKEISSAIGYISERNNDTKGQKADRQSHFRQKLKDRLGIEKDDKLTAIDDFDSLIKLVDTAIAELSSEYGLKWTPLHSLREDILKNQAHFLKENAAPTTGDIV